MSLRLRASSALGVGGAHRSWRRNEARLTRSAAAPTRAGLLDVLIWAHGSKGVLVGSLPAFCSEKTNGPLTRNAIFQFAFLRYATLLRQYRRCEPHS